MEEEYTLTWEEAGEIVETEEVICGIDNENMIAETGDYEDVCEEVIVHSEEVVPDDGVVYLTEEVLVMDEHQEYVPDSAYMDCVTEEVVADNWETCNELVVGHEEDIGVEDEQAEDDVMIPLPTDQDQYSAMRPYPCDFCSRRFRKKANLMNHMVAHQTDKPHGCNLCGVRYVRKIDLMNHLKIHAYVPETDNLEEELEDDFGAVRKRQKPGFMSKKPKKLGRKIKDEQGPSSRVYNYTEDGRLIDESGGDGGSELLSGETRYPVTDTRKPFVCQYCGVGFAREKALASHARMHQGDSPFECRRCGEMFWDVNLMREHIKTKHDGMEDDFLDGDDDDEFSEEENNKYGEFFCQTCGMTFQRQEQLKRHQRVHIKTEFVAHESEYLHICNVCGEQFAEALDLLAHAEVHARTPEFRCNLCGDTAPDEQALAAHVQAKHGDNLPENTCLHCGRICKDRRALMTHCLEHSKEKTFPCPKCPKTFHNKARLKRHMLSHRNKAVQCDVCGEDFPDGRSLMNHRHSHSSVSGRQFPCRECGKTFGSRSSQQIHIRIHTGERPYGCRFCWKAFADGGTLRKHERIHTGEKPYACAVCPRAFNQRVVLREHIRSHHSGPDPNYSNTMTPYSCAVCSDMFSTSQDLILHLIHHCDLNTAMRRQPQIGPRKYKRRRKLKPHELELMSTVNPTPFGMEDVTGNIKNEFFNSDDDETKAGIQPKKKRKNSTSAAKSPETSYADVFNSFSSAIENINTIVNTTKTAKQKKRVGKDGQTSSGRPKMIHTQKTKVAVEGHDTGRAKHKTKTLITRTEHMADLKSPTGDRIRPRTKNVSYHILNPDKLPIATFEDATEQAVNSLLAFNQGMDHEEIVNGADSLEEDEQEEADPLMTSPEKHTRRRSTSSSEGTAMNAAGNSLAPGRHIIGGGQVVKFVGSGMIVKKKVKIEKPDPIEEIETEEHDPLGSEFINVKQEIIENPLNELAELSMQHAQNVFRCEMCSAVFSDRAQLLLHVPIHI